ncbi:MAG: hypothetical protein M1296_04090 [Chloroflexi bacterium]|nr:hypothetical protein [Chloroflexota bacterium]
MTIQRSTAALFGGAAVILVAGIVVALIAGRQPEATVAPDSPAGAVATYLRLLQRGQFDDAYAMTAFSSAAKGPAYEMTHDGFVQQYSHWSEQPHRVTLIRATTTSDHANVVVEISTFEPGPFGPSDRSSQQIFTLERRDATWRITGPVYLYP